jgi:putative oxidoreductase
MAQNNWKAWAESRRELWLDCIRIYLGLGLFVRGLILVFNVKSDLFVDLLSKTDQPWFMSAVALHYVALAHFVGGAMLALGFLTRIAAFVQLPILLGAVVFVHSSEGLLAVSQSLEFSALVLFLLCVFLVNGAGRFSLDHAVFGEKGNSKANQATA